MAEIISITEMIQDKKDGPWFVFQDPTTDAVNVVPMALIEGWFMDTVKIDKSEHLEVIRAILLEWYELRFGNYQEGA